MTFASPWTLPPPPEEGDVKPEPIYEAVGLAMSEWEQVEMELGKLYSDFLGIEVDEAIQSEEFRKASRFVERQKVIEEAGEAYFRRYCNQWLEGQLREIFGQTQLASIRRNDIAHAFVAISLSGVNQRSFYFLYPSAHYIKKFINCRPLFKFCSYHIRAYAENFGFLQFAISEFRQKLVGPDAT